MDTSWWVALGVVVLLAFVAALVDGRGRLGPRRRDGLPGEPPAPGEVWLARLPGGKEHPFLVLTVRADGGARVARLAPEPPGSPEVLVLPPEGGGPLYPEPEGLADIGAARLVRRTGEVAPEVWDEVRHLAE
ncbi:hypothetical protein GCM10009801_55860 [Streptomyces albiaxialis]|uniref:Type II toxin-antitoxin system PemK/MazF family toxin n=1 Tax=Streptomyces albiaxialis TaxID=329523 RepID=A0ABN2WFN0_9ACTN